MITAEEFLGEENPRPSAEDFLLAPVAKFSGAKEDEFQQWYRERAKKLNINLNPDDPAHHYDYRSAFLAGAEPDNTGHWPSEFKSADHPNRFVFENGKRIDSVTGDAVPSAEEFLATDSPPARKFGDRKEDFGLVDPPLERPLSAEETQVYANLAKGYPIVAQAAGSLYDAAVSPLLPRVPRVSGAEVRQAMRLGPMASKVAGALGLPTELGVKGSQVSAGTLKAAAGLVDFLSSPAGIAGMAAPAIGFGRAAAGVFAADMARHQAEIARAAGTAVGSGDLEGAVESGIGLGLNTVLPGLAGSAALTRGEGRAVSGEEGSPARAAQTGRLIPQAEPAVSPEISAELDRMEGAPALPKAEEFLDLPADVQTSGEDANVVRLREELADLNDQPGKQEVKGAAQSFERPADVLDWMEGQGLRLRKLGKGEASDFGEAWRRAQKGTPEAFDDSGLNPDDVAERYRRETGKELSDEDFLAEVEGVKAARAAAVDAQKKEFGQLSQDANWAAEAVEGRRRTESKGLRTERVEQVGAEELAEGDKFEVGGEKVVVERVKARPVDETMVESVTVKDGPRFGTRVLAGDATLKIDEGSLQRTEGGGLRTEWLKSAEVWADRTIEAAKGRVSSGLDPELLAAYAVKGAAILARGVVEAGKWAAEMVREYGDAIREHLPAIRAAAEDLAGRATAEEKAAWLKEHSPAALKTGKGERQFPQQVDISTDVSGEVKLRQGARLYERRTNEGDAELARRLIEEHGLERAGGLFRAEDAGMPESVRTALGLELVKRWGQREQVAALSRDAAGERAAVEAQVELLEGVTRRSTDLAQGLQAMAMWSRLTPAGQLEAARRTIEGARAAGIGAMKPGLDNIKETLRSVNEAVSGEVMNDAAVVKAAEPLMEPMAGKVATAVASKRVAAELLKGRMLETAKGKAAGISELAGRHFAGEDVARTLQRKLWEDLKIPYDQAKLLARRLEVEFAKLVRAEAAKVMAEARRAVWARRHAELLAMARRHFVQGDDARPLVDKIKEILKVGDKEAAGFAEKLSKRFADLATERKRAALRRLTLPARVGAIAGRGLHERLIELSNLGALDDAGFDRAVAEKLKLPQWTRDLAIEVKRRAEAMQKAPDGFQRQRLAVDMMNTIARAEGVKWWELPMAFWYAHALSGPMSHAVNAASNGVMLATHLGLTMLRTNPAAWDHLMASVWRGLGKGSVEARQLLKTGVMDGTRLEKMGSLSPLELMEFRGIAAPLKLWRYVGRAMSGADLVFFKSAEEMHSYAAGRVIAKTEGLAGEALERRVVEVMGRTDERIAEARATADREGLSGLDWRRRVDEVIEQSRPEILRENAKEYALRVTFNGEPYGLLGEAYKSLVDFRQRVPAMRLVLPFMKIAMNLTNEGMNYLPGLGQVRALRGWYSGAMEGKAITDRTVLYDQWSKSTLGFLGLAALAVLVKGGKIDLSGAGPVSGNHKKQLQETGWKEYSVKIGNTWYPYGWTPFAIPVSILANFFDAQKYRAFDEAEILDRVMFAWSISGHVILQQSCLSGLTDFLKMADTTAPKHASAAFGRWATRAASTFVVPNALRFVDQVFDPTVYEANTVQGMVVASVPFARRLNRPAINVLGEPVSKYVSDRFLSGERGDALWEALAAKQAWVSVPDRDVVIGDKKRGPDHYRTLNDAEYYLYVKESGEKIRQQLMNRLPKLERATPDEAKEMVRKVTAEARERAKGRF